MENERTARELPQRKRISQLTNELYEKDWSVRRAACDALGMRMAEIEAGSAEACSDIIILYSCSETSLIHALPFFACRG